MTNNALIVVAHGSRRQSSNKEVEALTQKVKPLVVPKYSMVKTAFLELATPSIEESIVMCMDEGATHIVIFPYFLAYGNHVSHDIPTIVASMKQKYPHVTFTLKEHLGAAIDMPLLISNIL